MEDKSKLIVIDRKEVFLIFALMILIAVTSFIMGVRIGKNYSYASADLLPADQQKVEIMSSEEENVEKLSNSMVSEVSTEEEKFVDTQQRLQEEFNRLGEEENNVGVSNKNTVMPIKQEVVSANHETVKAQMTDYQGKYTVQLSSHRSRSEAEEFASGFQTRGYNPIIYEVELSGKGTWFRVSLGVFNNSQEAKDYIKKQSSLFLGQEPLVAKFQ